MNKHARHAEIVKKIQVNVPFRKLENKYLPLFLEYGLNPEIGIDGQTLDTTSTEEFKRIAEVFKHENRSITIHGPFMDLVPGGLDNMLLTATRERLKRFFEIIPVFEPAHVVCHTGYDQRRYREHWNEWLANSVVTWTPHVYLAERRGFKLLLENVYETSPDVHVALFDKIPSHAFGFCLDVGHHHVFGKSPHREWVKTLGDKILALHLHDNNGKEDSHWAIGKGNVDFKGLFQLVCENGLRPAITLEPHEEETLWQSLASEDLKEFIQTVP
jgi:sugar phosphate isomerase/epimerase